MHIPGVKNANSDKLTKLRRSCGASKAHAPFCEYQLFCAILEQRRVIIYCDSYIAKRMHLHSINKQIMYVVYDT